MKDFAAIDFETANQQRTSVCSVGIVIVRDGEIADSYYSLIKPEPEYYSYWNTRVHGLTLEDTMNADVFPKVWGRNSAQDRRSAPGCPQRPLRRRLPEGSIPDVSDGISRL